tara:strand:- start:1137 stop:1505 length:369 start_codon:yes stop_codon:yes gene_type:complete
MPVPVIVGGVTLAKLAWKPTLKLAKKLVKKYKKSDDAVLKKTAFSIDEILFATTLATVAAPLAIFTPGIKKDIKKDIKIIQDRVGEKQKKPKVRRGYSNPEEKKRNLGGVMRHKPIGFKGQF